jgi:hypothetical protein
MTAIENSLAAMMAAAQSAGIETFMMLIGPWTGNGSDATNAQMASIDSINASTIAVAPGYGATVLDQRCVVGQQRASGPGGNCWDIQPQYLYSDGLGVHLNPAGEQQVANLISLSLQSFRYAGGVVLKGVAAQK